MRLLIQRVSQAKVTVGDEVTGQIENGLLVFLGITHGDSEKEVDYLIEKIVTLRVFPGEGGEFDRPLADSGGGLLIVSQFTLYGSTNKGRRPDFTSSAPPAIAEPLYELFIKKLQERGLNVATGRFGAMMKVELTNDGPATFMLESK